jgi:hypothetical protein
MAKVDPTVAESSRTDANQQFTLIGVQGTLGTADVTGSARTMTFGGNPVTGAMYVETTNAGAASNPTAGTLNTIGTLGSVTNLGSFTNGGTIKEVSNLAGGTVLNTGTTVNIATGTQQTLGTVANINNGSINILTGTLQSSGTTTGVGVVSNVTQGSINILTGTLQSSGTTTGVGVVTNLTNGSINILTGTTTLVSTVTTVSNLTNGSINILTGTVTRLSNVGTLESGTVKLDPTPVPATLQFGTLGTAGGSFFGTLSAVSGAGTKHYISGVDIVMQTGTADVRILAGSVIQGTGVLAGGAFSPNGGISKRIVPAFVTGTNSELIYHFVGAGTAFINISYWKGV